MNYREIAFQRELLEQMAKMASAASAAADFLDHTRAAASDFMGATSRREDMAKAFGLRRLNPFAGEGRAYMRAALAEQTAKYRMRRSAKEGRRAAVDAFQSGMPEVHDAALRTYTGADKILAGGGNPSEILGAGSRPADAPARSTLRSLAPWVAGGGAVAAGGAYALKRRREQQAGGQDPYAQPPG